MQSKVKLAILSLITANIIWGAAFPIYKLALTDIPPFTFVFLRFFIAAVILFPFVFKDLKIKAKDLISLILVAIFGITLTISFLNFGLKLSSSINAPIIASAGPIVLIIGSFFYLKEKIKRKIVYGTIVSLLGVLTIVFLPVFQHGIDGTVTGNVFIVFATIFSVIHVLLLKKLLVKYKALTIVFWSFLIGSLPIIPFLMTEFNTTHWTSHLTYPVVFGILFSVIVATVIAHSIFTYGIKYISANETGIFAYIDPIAAVLVAVPLLGERVTIPYLVGAFFVFAGILIAEKRLNYHPIHRLFRN